MLPQTLGRRIALRLLVLAQVACVSGQPGPIVAPLGDYETEVGAPWALDLVVLDSAAGTPRWTLIDGPAAMTLTNAGRHPAQLVWLATAFDLALQPPGKPRAAGTRQTIHMRLCDPANCCVESSGTIRAVPSR